jgi:mRNA interferase MazF
VREICLVNLDEPRPRRPHPRCRTSREAKVTVAPITTTVKGLSSKAPVGSKNRLDHDCAISLDKVVTVPVGRLGRTICHVSAEQEARLARAVISAYDLDIPLLR